MRKERERKVERETIRLVFFFLLFWILALTGVFAKVLKMKATGKLAIP